MAEGLYVLWGSAGHAKVLANIVALHGGRVVATFDVNPNAVALPGVPLYIGEQGFARWADSAEPVDQIRGFVAIGGSRGHDRISIQAMFARRGLSVEAIAHPDASIDESARLGAGTQLLAQAVVAAGAVLGVACIVNHKASVDHECILGDGVHIAPGATLCGLVKVGDRAFVGAGAVVLPRLSIGADAVVGAGAVVTRDVPAGAVVAGNPARIQLKGNP